MHKMGYNSNNHNSSTIKLILVYDQSFIVVRWKNVDMRMLKMCRTF